MSGAVHIVHAIDTEGPLYESIEAKFERLSDLFDVGGIEPTLSNLKRLHPGAASARRACPRSVHGRASRRRWRESLSSGASTSLYILLLCPRHGTERSPGRQWPPGMGPINRSALAISH